MKKSTPAYGTEKVTDNVTPAPEQRTFSKEDDAKPYDQAFFDQGKIETTDAVPYDDNFFAKEEVEQSNALESQVASELAEVAKMREEHKKKVTESASVSSGEAPVEVEKPPVRMGMIIFDKISEGNILEGTEIAGDELKVGIFSNTRFPETEKFSVRREIATPRVAYANNRVVVRMIDAIQDNDEDLNVFKKTLVESHASKSYDPIRHTDIGMSEMRVDIDLAEGDLQASSGTSDLAGYFGNKCFLISGDNIYSEFSNSGIKMQLRSGDIVLVASNGILNRLMEEDVNARSKDATTEYRESVLGSEMSMLLKSSRDEAGKLNQQALFDRLDAMFKKKSVIGPETKMIAAYVAYQVP